jgi:thiopurine S-methyltransferase
MKQTIDWHGFWSRERQGFHEGRVNRFLQRYLPEFGLQAGDAIFVPLCGKAVDMRWLAEQGHPVIGVELSPVAIESFFAESGLPYQRSKEGPFTVYRSINLTLYQGDYMQLEARQLEGCKLVYDRASLVAIEPFNRSSYVAQMRRILPPVTPMLLVTLEYDQDRMDGPPFSVPLDEVRSLYHSGYLVKELEQVEQIDERPKWREIGLESLKERALKLEPRQ